MAKEKKINHRDIIEDLYNQAVKIVNENSSQQLYSQISDEEKKYLDIVSDNAEKKKGVLTVLITSLVHKNYNPDQDIRLHQENLHQGSKKGYSGRGIDTKHITPFMKDKNFPNMSESGWLTRSLEQNYPYNFSYRGKISPKELKNAFLNLIDNIEEKNKNPDLYLLILLSNLIIRREKKKIELIKPTSLTIDKIIYILEQHFNYSYGTSGAARLPVLAIYSVYQSMMNEVMRFNNKKLMPIEEHTSSDSKTGRVGDIEIKDRNNRVFEAVEIKHKMSNSIQLIKYI